ncbi:MAG: hypothetical protein HOL85_21820 [Rhodospirillaceae bacterium]|mgnify:CR=1 FL=1|jgi:hypothetical protein|nr:hypothetical protein [Rhodospirillaceae bacterium]
MIKSTTRVIVLLAVCLALAGCLQEKKADLIDKSKGIETVAELEKALGKPKEVSKIGPLEQWIYEASDGKLVFSIVAGRVALEHTEDKK